jgi:hypothetical protein
MPIWHVLVDLMDSNWEASSHRGPVGVRTPDAASARETAEAMSLARRRCESAALDANWFEPYSLDNQSILP